MRYAVLVLGAFLMAVSAAMAEPHPYDTYLGQRAYPDPFIGDGWKPSDGYRRGDFGGTNWYRLRIRPVVQIYEHEQARYAIRGDIDALRR